MSPNDIAVASIITSGVTAVASVVGTGIGGWRDRVHQRAMADRDRQQARLADAYVGLLEYVSDEANELRSYLPMTSVNANPERTVYHRDEARRSTVLARVDAYGSNEVKGLTYTWTERVRDVLNAAHDFRYEQVKAANKDDVLFWRADWDNVSGPLKGAEASARQALKDRVAAELR